jgi:hypothetical protein
VSRRCGARASLIQTESPLETKRTRLWRPIQGGNRTGTPGVHRPKERPAPEATPSAPLSRVARAEQLLAVHHLSTMVLVFPGLTVWGKGTGNSIFASSFGRPAPERLAPLSRR